MCVIKIVIVGNGQSIRVFVFLYKIELVNGRYGCKDSRSRRTLKLYDQFKSYKKFMMFFINNYFFGIWNQSSVDNGGVSRQRSVAVGVSDR